MASIRQSWKRIRAWYSSHVPAEYLDLQPGAPAAEIKWAQDEVGLIFPNDVLESYGLVNGNVSYSVFPYGLCLSSLEKLVKDWNMHRTFVESDAFVNYPSRPKGPIRPVQWNLRWLPIAHNNGGSYYCLDMDPAEGGEVGQVIDYQHEDGPKELLAPSWGRWLEIFADDLEADKYQFDEGNLWLEIAS